MKTVSVAIADGKAPVRGTQLLVEHMSKVFRRPSLVAIEIGWRWLFGIPFFFLSWRKFEQIVATYPLDSSGANSIDTQNPWVGAVQLSNVIAFYEPHIAAALRWLLPMAAVAWMIVSGLGRNFLFMRMDSRMRFRPVAMILLQGAWLAWLGLAVWGWFVSMRWVAATHISGLSEPDLIGYFIWAITLSLTFFTAFALTSWAFIIAPIPVLLKGSALSGFGEAFRLGKAFTGKLTEVNLVLGIVKLALLVVAMVFSAAPLPFADELGAGALHFVTAASILFYFAADDFFQVVRLKAFVGFWEIFRGPTAIGASPGAISI
ncbi:MAG TPA: hypothetical protein VMT38_07285 [Terracidiphilus sp.]|nr:hypothetical protein [Terracidiphilus sp.]